MSLSPGPVAGKPGAKALTPVGPGPETPGARELTPPGPVALRAESVLHVPASIRLTPHR